MESTIISHVKELISKLKDIYSLNKLERRRPSDVMMRCLQGTHSPNTHREKREGGREGKWERAMKIMFFCRQKLKVSNNNYQFD